MTQTQRQSRLLTISEAASWIQVSDATILGWIASGALPIVPCGSKRAIRLDDLERTLAMQRRVTDSRPAEARLSSDDQRRWQEALGAARRLRAEWLARRRGARFSPSWELLDDARGQRPADEP